MVLVEEEHDSEVAEALVCEFGRGDEFEALDLAKVGGVAEHVDVEELGDIVVARVRVCGRLGVSGPSSPRGSGREGQGADPLP